MSPFAVVFPGQGSQSIGMLADLATQQSAVVETFTEASDALGYDLWSLVQQGPDNRLNATEQTQPAMLTAGVAVWRCWRECGGALPIMAAGHSLGEYSALVAADSIAFADAVTLVRLRGQLMQQAVPQGEGAIAALLGLDDAIVEEVCADACEALPKQHVSAVNFNAPGQVVIAGHRSAVECAIQMAKDRNVRRAMYLPMSAPVHCELMLPAADPLRERLDQIKCRLPTFPVQQNATMVSPADVDAMRDALVRQLWSPIQWVQTVKNMLDEGVRCLVECGPGKILTQLTRRIDRSLVGVNTQDPQSLSVALKQIDECGNNR